VAPVAARVAMAAMAAALAARVVAIRMRMAGR